MGSFLAAAGRAASASIVWQRASWRADAVRPYGFAEAMHRSALRPFSQFVHYDKARGSAVWQLAALNKEAEEEILYALDRLPQNLYLKQKEYVVQLSKPQLVKQTSYKDMAEQFFTMPQPPRMAEFNFITSASFKAFGSYKIYPDNVYISAAF